MRILFFSDNFPPETNAIASRVFERVRWWVKWGHEVTIVTSVPNFPEGKMYPGYENRWYQVERRDGIRVVRIKTFITANEGVFLRTIDFLSYIPLAVITGLREKRPDIVVGTSPQFFVGVAAWLVSFLRRLPFVFEIADLWPASVVAVGAMKKNVLIRFLEKLELFLYHRAQVIVALTPAFKKDLIQRGVPSEKIQVVINGVELEMFSPIVRDATLAAQWRLTDCFVVGYIGTQGMAHGLENVIEAAQHVATRDPNVRLLFVGTGAAHEELVKLVQARGVENVVFIPPQPKQEIRRFWGLCDVALVHLKNDPVFSTVIPSKMFEAMAMGLPLLLVAPPGEASYIVEKEKVGVWVPAGDPAAFAQAVSRLKEDNALRGQYKTKSLATASRYSRERQARDMYSVLAKVGGR